MSEIILDKQVDKENENLKKNSGVHASPRKVCNENNSRRTKRLPCKNFLLKGGLIRLYQKTGWSDFDEL